MGSFISLFRRNKGYTTVVQVLFTPKGPLEHREWFGTLEEALDYLQQVVSEGNKSPSEITHIEIYRNKEWVKILHTYF